MLLTTKMPQACCVHQRLPQTVSCPRHPCLASPASREAKHEPQGECDSLSACRSGPGLRHALQLRTGKNTAWQAYKPSECALQHLAYCVHPRQQVQLAELQPEMIGSNVDMTCVLLWAGAIGRGQSSPVGLYWRSSAWILQTISRSCLHLPCSSGSATTG